MLINLKCLKLIGLVSTLTFSQVACTIYEDDDDDDYDYEPYSSSYNSYDKPYSTSYNNNTTSSYDYLEKAQERCDKNSFMQKVVVHYDISENLGLNRVVVVEVFDNSYFMGIPVAQSIVTDFNAAQSGSKHWTELELEPGRYYLRAHLRKDAPLNKPIGYHDLEQAAKEDNQIYGATSAPTALEFRQGDTSNPYGTCQPESVDIYIDQLFEPEDVLPSTNARIRILFDVAEGESVPDLKLVHVQLREDDDFAYDPIYEFTMPSEVFLIEGRINEAEFVTPQLEPGRYTLQVFVDYNENGFLDDGELKATYIRAEEAGLIKVVEDRTETVNLTLGR